MAKLLSLWSCVILCILPVAVITMCGLLMQLKVNWTSEMAGVQLVTQVPPRLLEIPNCTCPNCSSAGVANLGRLRKLAEVNLEALQVNMMGKFPQPPSCTTSIRCHTIYKDLPRISSLSALVQSLALELLPINQDCLKKSLTFKTYIITFEALLTEYHSLLDMCLTGESKLSLIPLAFEKELLNATFNNLGLKFSSLHPQVLAKRSVYCSFNTTTALLVLTEEITNADIDLIFLTTFGGFLIGLSIVYICFYTITLIACGKRNKMHPRDQTRNTSESDESNGMSNRRV